MRPTVILAALCAVLLASSADARPRHHHRSAETTSTISMSRPIPPGLHRVMASGGSDLAGRVLGAGVTLLLLGWLMMYGAGREYG
ncbi:hypothetical protein [Nitrobacter sp.]|uniref:hypothetical protein n=1 Tax=Nitrobacter sp. TaxID=29420 RepID=UPI001D286494|nr:hypothetical protein [Nitrobacter sp.]MCB1393232.1 hypothetical protein [Nitrobacter sp.]